MGGGGQRPTALQEFPPLTSFAAEWWCLPGEGDVMGGGGWRWQEGTSCAPPPIFSLPPPARTIPRSAPALSGIPIHYHHINRRRNPPCGQRPTALQGLPPLTAFAAEWWCYPGGGMYGRRREAIAESHVLSAAAHLPSRAAAPHHSAQRASVERNPLTLPPY